MDANLKELLGNAGFGELDNVEFDHKDDYVEYFDYIKTAFKAFNKHLSADIEQSASKGVQYKVISYFITRFLRSIELLSIKYQFDESHSIRIDVTESSFPNHSELRQMKADYNLKDSFIEGLPDVLVLKDKLLGKLRVQEEEPLEILDALTKRRYFSNLYPASIYLMNNKGRLIDTELTKDGRSSYIYAWGTYDMALNRPQIFVLEFGYSEEKKKLDKDNEVFVKFEEIVDNISAGSQSIYEMIAFIDQEIPTIHPKIIKKYDLGPLYGSYSKDENEFTKFHKRHNLDNRHFVMTYEEETVVSVGETMVKSSWMSSKMPLQDFHINKTDAVCRKRKLSEINKTLIAPHQVIQLLLEDPKMKEILVPLRNNMIAI